MIVLPVINYYVHVCASFVYMLFGFGVGKNISLKSHNLQILYTQ